MLPVEFNIVYEDFSQDPYPTLSKLRKKAPISFVPQLGAILLSKHGDIFVCEKNISVFSSVQPDGLMTRLMGQNMMRKDGEEHKKERHIIFPTTSPKTTQNVWKQKFVNHTKKILDNLSGQQEEIALKQILILNHPGILPGKQFLQISSSFHLSELDLLL